MGREARPSRYRNFSYLTTDRWMAWQLRHLRPTQTNSSRLLGRDRYFVLGSPFSSLTLFLSHSYYHSLTPALFLPTHALSQSLFSPALISLKPFFSLFLFSLPLSFLLAFSHLSPALPSSSCLNHFAILLQLHRLISLHDFLPLFPGLQLLLLFPPQLTPLPFLRQQQTQQQHFILHLNNNKNNSSYNNNDTRLQPPKSTIARMEAICSSSRGRASPSWVS